MLHFVEQIMDVLMGWTNKKQTAFKTYEKKNIGKAMSKTKLKKKRKTNWREKTNQNEANLFRKNHSNLIQEMKWNL